MAIGDDGVLGGMPLVPGSLPAKDLDTEDNRSHDYIAGGPAFWKPGVVVPIAKGGTGAATPADARAALGAAPSDKVTKRSGFNDITLYWNGVRVNVNVDGFEVGTIPYSTDIGSAVAAAMAGYVAKSGDTMTGHLYLPNSVAASTGYTIAYINGDGRLSRGASSERYKDDITPIDPIDLGDIFPQLHTFVMNDDPGRMERVGYIAERLDESDDLRRFVIYQREPVYEDVLTDIFDEAGAVVGQRVVDRRVVGSTRSRDENGDPIPDSIDFIALLLAEVAQLHARDEQREMELEQLAARIEALEARA
ncbi:hypothetical protein [Microbacterium kyungheense]|uniref:Endosialidase-like protein n=1 Tax=Microbacterium kyungheense TaxID=1263636 RepID=A0A543EU74_9MICO|nr:hypothetical protein [Microbacterium kyungheense]TQM25119.1 hypothetical protein FB391_2578 [Microbacterium kyungheense]